MARSSYFSTKDTVQKPPPIHRAAPTPGTPEIDATTVLSLFAALSVLIAAYALSVRFLPSTATLKTRILFVWHLFDALIHLLFEGSFLYNCFFVSYALPTSFSASARNHPRQLLLLTPPDVYFLGQETRLYGANYGTGPFSRLWQEYAKADRRWGGADLTVISLELLTVFGGAPLALWICEMLRRGDGKGANRKWFWMVVLATGELYGGFMTFAPEWLSGSPNLDTSNWMYLWVYLFFFNTLWVWFPLWILYEGYKAISAAMSQAEMVDLVNYLKKDD